MNSSRDQKQRSVMTTVLIGCGIGCGALAIVGVIGALIGGVWAFSPGQQRAAASIVSDDSLGSIHVEDLAKDAGVRSMLTEAFRRWDEVNRRRQAEMLPENMRWLSRMQGQSNPTGMGFMIPREIVIAVEEGDGEPMISAAINFRAMVRPFRWMVLAAAGQEDEILEIYRDYEIVGDDTVVMAFADSTLLVADRRKSLRLAIDRMEDGGETPVAPFDPPPLPAPETEWDVYGGLHNRQYSVEALLEWWLPLEEPLPSGAESLRFGIDWETADSGFLRLDLQLSDPQSAAEWRPLIEQQLADAAMSLGQDGLLLESDLTSVDATMTLDVEFSGLQAAITTWIENFDQATWSQIDYEAGTYDEGTDQDPEYGTGDPQDMLEEEGTPPAAAESPPAENSPAVD